MVSFLKRYQYHQTGTPPPSGQSRHHRLPLVLPYPFSSPLRVTLTHFTLSFYERALRLPTFAPISDLARLGVKPRLCRSSWRAFASTHPLMLPSTSHREALVACPPFPPWNLLSFTLESTLSSLYFCSDALVARQGAALAHLDSLFPHDLVLWTDTLFLLLLAKAAPAYLPTALFVVLRSLFPFQQAQYAQVFRPKPAPFCTLFAGLGSTKKPATPLLLSYYMTLVLFSLPCPLLHLSFYLKLSG